MAAKKLPAITGLHSQGIADDIIKIGVKGVKSAVKRTVKEKRWVAKTVKNDYLTPKEMVKQGLKWDIPVGKTTKAVKSFRKELKGEYKKQGRTTVKGNIQREVRKVDDKNIRARNAAIRKMNGR